MLEQRFLEIYGFYPEDYFKAKIKKGVAAGEVIKEINKAMNKIWQKEKKAYENNGFYDITDECIPFQE